MSICIIPARGNSKRIPRKNIKNFCGKPMIAWSIEKATQSGCFDQIIVNTDDDEIADISLQFGADLCLERNKKNSDDYTTISDVIVDSIYSLDKNCSNLDYVCCLLATAPLLYINDLISDANAEKCKYPFVWKSARFGYDGKGVKVIFDIKDLKGLPDIECIIEDKVSIKKELSIIIARNNNSQEINFPTVEMEFNDANLVDKVICPAQISDEINKKAIEIALKTSRAFNHIGLLAIELFLTEGDEILINEVAPRPHNSGHHTIECCMTSQFEQHLRAVLNLDLGSTSIKIPGVMLNLVGEENHTGEVIYEKIEDVLKTEGASIHIYGKKQTKPNRKMGHITIVNKELNNAKKLAEKIRKSIKVISK